MCLALPARLVSQSDQVCDKEVLFTQWLRRPGWDATDATGTRKDGGSKRRQTTECGRRTRAYVKELARATGRGTHISHTPLIILRDTYCLFPRKLGLGTLR